MQYWDYYKDDFDWPEDKARLDYLALTRRRFAELGLSEAEIESFIRSGYVMAEDDVVIDAYYGGLLLGADLRTRIPVQDFVKHFDLAGSNVPVASATSLAEVHRQIDAWRASTSKTLLFRGQTSSYPLKRERPNPALQARGFGEISLVPSLWRVMLRKKIPGTFHWFRGLSTFEWSRIIYEQFDLAEIERRHQKLLNAGEWIYSPQDMVDSDDPLLQEFGRTRLDLIVGYSTTQEDGFNTLLQHYGLYSPVLDLTSDIDVALFFATHKLCISSSSYKFIGNNNRQSVLYVFGQNKIEMLEHEHERALHQYHPLRPLRQSCVICRSGAFALNLAADFLIGIIKLDFDHDGTRKYSTAELFPGPSEDSFLRAMKKNAFQPDRVTDFRP
jgi:hypothetical protein